MDIQAEDVSRGGELLERLRAEIAKAVVGQRAAVEQTIIARFCEVFDRAPLALALSTGTAG